MIFFVRFSNMRFLKRWILPLSTLRNKFLKRKTIIIFFRPFPVRVQGPAFSQSRVACKSQATDISPPLINNVNEWAEFNKSCNLIGSGSGGNFPIRSSHIAGSLQTGSPYELFRDLLSNGARSTVTHTESLFAGYIAGGIVVLIYFGEEIT